MRNEKLHENSVLQGFGFLTPEDGTDRLSRIVGKKYHYSLRNNTEERISHLLRGGSLNHGGVFMCHTSYNMSLGQSNQGR